MYIDTHAHLYIDRFEEDIEDIILRSKNNAVERVLLPNIDLETIEDVFALSRSYPGICFPMVGLHPCSVKETWKSSLDQLSSYLDREGIVAIGEIGVDLYWDKTYAKAQEEAFRSQIIWAKEKNLPIVIHSRSAIDITIRIIQEEQDGNLKGVFHCFDQSFDHVSQIMDVGFYMGIGGILTYKKNQQLRETVARIPMSSILLETDAPYLPPVPYRGKRNESSYIPIIAEKLAEIKDISIEKVMETTTQNAKSLFKIE